MANVKISELPSLSTMTNTAEIPVVSNGTTYQITGANLQNYFTSSYGNANVVANLAALGSNPVSTTGNVTGGNLNTSGIVSATSVTVTSTGTAINAGQGNILTNKVTGNQFAFLNGSYTAVLTGSGATANYTLNLPANVGTNAQVLTSDGTGNLVWATGGGGNGSALVNGDNSLLLNSTVYPTITLANVSGNQAIVGIQTTTNDLLLDSLYSNVIISANDGVEWKFDISGNLTLPGNASSINYANGDPYGGGGGGGLPLANGNSIINIATSDGNVTIQAASISSVWTFGTDGKITLPNGASLNDTSGESVAFGQNAGLTSQAQHAVAIGSSAGSLYQGEDSIAIGYQAGNQDQDRGVAIGYQAGYGGTLYRSVSDAQGGSGPVTTYFPAQAPNPSRLYVASTTNIETNQRVFGNNIQANTVVTAVYPGEDRVDITPTYTAAMSEGDPLTFVGLVIGVDDASNLVYPMRVTGTDIPANTFVQSAGCSVVTLNQYPTAPLTDGASLTFTIGQGAYSTAIGYRAGQNFQDDGAVAIGYLAGTQNQSIRAVAVGEFAGYSNQSANAVAVGDSAGEFTQGVNAVAVGYKAGNYQQGARAVAIGEDAGFNVQGEDAVAVGQKAGFASQGQMAIAIGNTAGYSGQTQEAVAIGYGTGQNSQQYAAVAIGANAASYNQGSTAVAIGHLAGNTSQGASAVAVGDSAGYNYQSGSAVAVGVQSGYNYQSQYAVAIGSAAGQGQGYSAVYQSGTGTEITITPNAYIQIGQRITGEYVPADTYVVDIVGASLTLSQAITGTPAVDTNWTAWGQQGISAVAIGQNAALDFQGNNAVAIGTDSGSSNQSANAVAIGYRAGFEAQGANAVAIGSLAGQSAQGNNSIILNATGVAINSTGANTFTVKPVRGDSTANLTGGGFKAVYYNPTTGEFAYSTD